MTNARDDALRPCPIQRHHDRMVERGVIKACPNRTPSRAFDAMEAALRAAIDKCPCGGQYNGISMVDDINYGCDGCKPLRAALRLAERERGEREHVSPRGDRQEDAT